MTGLFQIGDKLLQAQDIPWLLKRYGLMDLFKRNAIIDQAILTQTCTEEERAAAVEQFKAQQQITSPEIEATWLQSHSLTLEELEEMAIRPILIEKYKQATWQGKVENYFLSRKSNLDHVVYSLLRTRNPGLAHELYFRIQEGEQSFEEAARQHSEGPEAQTGGRLGPVPLSQPHPAIGKLLAVSQLGQIWSPRPLAEWYVIIRLDAFMPAQLDDSMRRRLIDELFETWLQQQAATVGPLQPLGSGAMKSEV